MCDIWIAGLQTVVVCFSFSFLLLIFFSSIHCMLLRLNVYICRVVCIHILF